MDAHRKDRVIYIRVLERCYNSLKSLLKIENLDIEKFSKRVDELNVKLANVRSVPIYKSDYSLIISLIQGASRHIENGAYIEEIKEDLNRQIGTIEKDRGRKKGKRQKHSKEFLKDID